MTSLYYEAFGLSFRTNRILLAMPAQAAPRSPVTLNLWLYPNNILPNSFKTQAQGRWQPAFPSNTGPLIYRSLDEPLYGVRFRDTSEFVFSQDGHTVWGTWDSDVLYEHIDGHILNSVLAIVMRLRGYACLHSSSIAVNEHAVLFVGASGRGKSTTAGYFTQQGHVAITDDFVVLRPVEKWFVVDPGYPSFRLFPDTGSVLRRSENVNALRPIGPRQNKHYLDFPTNGYRFADRALPIGLVYLLARRGNVTQIASVSPAHVLIELTKNLYPWRMIDENVYPEEVKSLLRLMEQVPIRSLTIPNDLVRLPMVYDAIQADLAAYPPFTMKP